MQWDFLLLPLHVKETFHIGCNAKCKGLNLFRFSMILPKKIEKVGAVCDLLDQSIWLKSTQGKISSVNSMENSTAHSKKNKSGILLPKLF